MRCVTLFAGGGGADLGLAAAGVEHLALSEWDPDACSTLRAAGFANVLEGDVRAQDWSPYAGRTDLVWASPPCQAFSSAGKRLGAEDDRNGWPWTFDAVDVIRPTWLIAENVPGLLQHQKAAACDRAGSKPSACAGCYFLAVVVPEALRRFAHVEVRVLDAADFGVPQHRRRVILVCGPTTIVWPAKTHGPPVAFSTLKPWRTIREALKLGGSLGGSLGGQRNSAANPAQERPAGLDEPAPTIGGGGNAILEVRVVGGGGNPHRKDAPDEPSTTIAAVQVGNAGPFVVTAPVRSRYVVGQGRAGSEPELLDEPAPTVTAQEVKGTRASSSSGFTFNGGPDRASDAVFLATGIRRLTVEECAALQGFPGPLDRPAPALTGGSTKIHVNGRSILSGNADARRDLIAAGVERLSVEESANLQAFPDGYPWCGTATSRYRIIGNAVPPALARVVGEAVIAADRSRLTR